MKETPSGRKAHYALCQCDCGETIEVLLGSLRNGNTISGISEKDGEYIAAIQIKGKRHLIGKYGTREEEEEDDEY